MQMKEEDSEIYYYVSVRYIAPVEAVTEWQVIDHGEQHSQYFQGCGVAFTPYDHVVTGVGSDAREALQDCIESMAQNGHTVTEEQELEMSKEI